MPKTIRIENTKEHRAISCVEETQHTFFPFFSLGQLMPLFHCMMEENVLSQIGTLHNTRAQCSHTNKELFFLGSQKIR